MSKRSKRMTVEQMPRTDDEAYDSEDNPLGQRLRRIRHDRRLSLEELAGMSGVSRATISKIELGQVTPGTTTLSKLTEVLGTSFAALVSPESAGQIVILRSSDQPVMRDDESGFSRRCIAPILPSRGLDWVLNELPAGETSGTFVPHHAGVEEYVFVLSGNLQATLGEDEYTLDAGDAIYFEAHVPHAFTAVGSDSCEYFLIINSQR